MHAHPAKRQNTQNNSKIFSLWNGSRIKAREWSMGNSSVRANKIIGCSCLKRIIIYAALLWNTSRLSPLTKQFVLCRPAMFFFIISVRLRSKKKTFGTKGASHFCIIAQSLRIVMCDNASLCTTATMQIFSPFEIQPQRSFTIFFLFFFTLFSTRNSIPISER